MNIGNAPNAVISGQPRLSQGTNSLPSSHPPNVIPSTAPILQSAPTVPSSSAPLKPFLETHESSNYSNHSTNLVTPSFFSPPSSSSLMIPQVPSSVPTAPPLHPPVTMQRPYGTPLLQPFPPPTPPPSLTPVSSGPIITKDKVHDALLRLVQVWSFEFCFCSSCFNHLEYDTCMGMYLRCVIVVNHHSAFTFSF